jgi:hypothetical protein
MSLLLTMTSAGNSWYKPERNYKHTYRLKWSKVFVSLEQPWLLMDGAQLLIVPLQCNASIPGHRAIFGSGGYHWISKDSRVLSLHYGEIYRRGRPSECTTDLH